MIPRTPTVNMPNAALLAANVGSARTPTTLLSAWRTARPLVVLVVPGNCVYRWRHTSPR